MLASASYPSPFPVIVPEFLSPISRFHGSACLLFYFFTHRHWFFCHDANLLMILALLIGCWCPRLHPPSTYFIHSCHCRNSHSSISSLLDRILLFQSLFVFSENIPQRQGRLVSLNLWWLFPSLCPRFRSCDWAYSRTCPLSLSTFSFFLLSLSIFFFYICFLYSKCLQHSGNEQKVARRKGSTRHGRLSIN